MIKDKLLEENHLKKPKIQALFKVIKESIVTRIKEIDLGNILKALQLRLVTMKQIGRILELMFLTDYQEKEALK